MAFKDSFICPVSLSLSHSLSFFFWPISYRLQHGVCSCTPLKYTHIDLQGHLPQPHCIPYCGNPVLAMSYCYLIQGKCLTLRNDLPYEMQYVCELDSKPVCISPCLPCKVSCDPPGTPCPPITRCPTYSNTNSCERQAQSYPPAQPASPCQPCPPNSETMYREQYVNQMSKEMNWTARLTIRQVTRYSCDMKIYEDHLYMANR